MGKLEWGTASMMCSWDLSPRVTADGGMLPPMESYAQNFEDVMLRRALQDVSQGLYIDVGAFEPDMHSVTKWFYDNGWNGINLEPHPEIFGRLAHARERDVNLNSAAAAEDGTMPFWLVGQTGMSSLIHSFCETIKASEAVTQALVPVVTLDGIVEKYAEGRTIDFLKIDVEGFELQVLRGAKLNKNRPRIILVEATLPMSQEPAWSAWEPLLLEANYVFAWFDGLNRFYVRDEDRDRLVYFRLPPCCFDNYRMVEQAAMARIHEMQATVEAQRKEVRRLTVMITRKESPATADGANQLAGPPLDFRVPISLGELLDKISILEIKSERITEEARLTNVRYELALLSQECERVLAPMPEDIIVLAAELKKVNELIWDAEDVIHADNASALPEDVFLKQARIAFDQNDIRARLKRKINDLTNSAVVEEKSYTDFGSEVAPK